VTYSKKTFVSVCYTYERVTPESAEDGDCSERGWYQPGGWYFDSYDMTAGERVPMTARDLLREIQSEVGYVEYLQLSAKGRELMVVGARNTVDYSTGEDESITAHIEGHPRLVRALHRKLSSR
jgi:hypothetical protein